MIYIGRPFIKTTESEVSLVSHVKNEAEGKETDLYYSVEPHYAKYLCQEQADAFVLPMLLRAVVTKQNIEVDAPVSEKLLHNLRHGLLYALEKAYNKGILPFLKEVPVCDTVGGGYFYQLPKHHLYKIWWNSSGDRL